MDNESKSKTPETDLEHEICKKIPGDLYRGFVTYAYARKLERDRDEARGEAIRWQDAWMNDTPLHEMGSTLMPWMRGWKNSSENTLL